MNMQNNSLFTQNEPDTSNHLQDEPVEGGFKKFVAWLRRNAFKFLFRSLEVTYLLLQIFQKILELFFQK